MAIDNDHTSALYNSYFVDIADLDTFVSALDGFWNLTSWNNLNDIQKENIMHAAIADSNSFAYVGAINASIISPYNMKFPRTSLEYQNGVDVGNTEIPLFMKEYVAERVLEKNANTNDGTFYDGRIKKNVLGKLSQEFQNPRDSKVLKNTLKNASSFLKIAPYVTGFSSLFNYVQRA